MNVRFCFPVVICWINAWMISAEFRKRWKFASTRIAEDSGLAKALLPILDDLERIIESGREHPDNAEAVVDGVKLTLDNLLKALSDFQVSRIDAAGQPFDPEVHEAMMEQPSPEHPERTVLQELSKGYRLHDRVIRPSKVIVSKPQAAEGEGTAPPAAEDGADQE